MVPLLAGHFNGEGKLDLALAALKNFLPGNFRALLGNGLETFGSAMSFALGVLAVSFSAGWLRSEDFAPNLAGASILPEPAFSFARGLSATGEGIFGHRLGVLRM